MMTDCIHVAVGVVRDTHNRVLIARRATHQHQGGLWEFPGGKVEASETVLDALQRELAEEVGIHVESARPLCEIRHSYPDKTVRLDVWTVDSFSGEAQGREGQPLRWERPADLRYNDFPVANRVIIRALQLPAHLVVINSDTPPETLHSWSIPDNAMVRLRAVDAGGTPGTTTKMHTYAVQAEALLTARDWAGRRILLDLHERELPDTFLALAARHQAIGGVYNNRHALANLAHKGGRDTLETAGLPEHWLLGCSAHNRHELMLAKQVRADFAILSPVLPSASHPDQAGMGWRGFAELSSGLSLPVYAMGGMGLQHLQQARDAGATGIAGISLFKAGQSQTAEEKRHPGNLTHQLR